VQFVSLTVYFLRHGQTPFSRDDILSGGRTDPELSVEGEQMAQDFAAAYKNLPFLAIYSSPLRRTEATARPICEALHIRPELRDGLKEIVYGAWEGRTREEVTHQFHDDYLLWTADPAWNPPTGGETALMVAQRAIRVIDEIRERFHDGNVLIISHKATIRIIICSLLGIDVGRFRYRLGCPVGSVSILEFSNRGPLLHALADRVHLREALRNLPGA
jgi:broad specificity phosphatase PhoE